MAVFVAKLLLFAISFYGHLPVYQPTHDNVKVQNLINNRCSKRQPGDGNQVEGKGRIQRILVCADSNKCRLTP